MTPSDYLISAASKKYLKDLGHKADAEGNYLLPGGKYSVVPIIALREAHRIDCRAKGLPYYTYARFQSGIFGWYIARIPANHTGSYHPDMLLWVGDNLNRSYYERLVLGQGAADAALVIQEENLLAVVKEKHGDRYFVIKSVMDAFKMALKLFEERDEYGYYPKPGDKDENPAPPFSKEEIATWPEHGIKDAALAAWKTYEAGLKYIEEEKADAKLAIEARKGNGWAALNLLVKRANGEYEGVEFESPEEIK